MNIFVTLLLISVSLIIGVVFFPDGHNLWGIATLFGLLAGVSLVLLNKY